MGHIDAHTTIRATPQQVYAFLSDPRNAPQYIGAIRRVEGGPHGAGKVGDRFNAEGEFMGKPAFFTLRLGHLEHERRVTMVMEGDMPANIHIELKPADGGRATQVSSRLDVPSTPGFMLEMVMGRILRDGLATLAGKLGAT